MSQFEQNPAGVGEYAEPKQTSGLAIGSLVCSLIFCCPLTTVIGIILGFAGVISIKGNAAKKGMGLAAAGIIIGVIATGGQIFVGSWFWGYIEKAMELVENGPESAMTSAASGDYDGTRSWFYGEGARTTDAEVEAFITEAQTRYGAFVGATIDEANPPSPTPGQPDMIANYVLEFENASVSSKVMLIFADQDTGQPVFLIGEVIISDAELGDLVYPVGGYGSGGNGGGEMPGETDDAENTEDAESTEDAADSSADNSNSSNQGSSDDAPDGIE